MHGFVQVALQEWHKVPQDVWAGQCDHDHIENHGREIVCGAGWEGGDKDTNRRYA